MENQILYRRLTSDDTNMYRMLRLRALKEHPHAFLESYAEALEKAESNFLERIEKSFIFGSFFQGLLVGTSLLAPMQGILQRHKGYIGAVYVAPEMRQNGIARQLLSTAIDQARAMGLELLQLGVNAHNPVSVSFYKSLGFEEYGIDRHVTKLSDGSYVDDILMVKFLKPLEPL